MGDAGWESDMYMPEFVIRIEFAQTDIDNVREWRVVLGGSQRGGLTVEHGYTCTCGAELLDNVEASIAKARELIETYAGSLSAYQLRLEIPAN